VDIRDITTTFVVTACPREVFKHLNSRLISYVHHSTGIYYVYGEAFPVQIVLTDRLNKVDNLWLQALRHGIEVDTINMVFDGYKPDVNIEAYLRVLFKANEQAAQEVLKMEGMALEEKLEQMGFVDKARLEEERAKLEEVWAKLERERAKNEKERTKWVELAKTMLLEGTSPQTISRWLNMPIEDILRDA
jgi:hypothetical protein